MTVTAQSFRVAFPEFADGSVYLTSTIQYYIALAGKMLNNPRRWGTLLDDGQMLFVAHHIVLEKQAMAAAANGGNPGVGGGIVQTKSVDKVSVGYDTTAGVDKEAGHWNLTVYGVRLKAMINMMGAGPIQIGVGCAPPNTLSSQEAWAGPPVFNFPNDSG